MGWSGKFLAEFSTDVGGVWSVLRSGSDEFTYEDSLDLGGRPAVTGVWYEPEDRVTLAVVPAERHEVGLPGRKAGEGRYWVEMVTVDGGRYLSAREFGWDEAITKLALFRGLSGVDAVRRWDAHGFGNRYHGRVLGGGAVAESRRFPRISNRQRLNPWRKVSDGLREVGVGRRDRDRLLADPVEVGPYVGAGVGGAVAVAYDEADWIYAAAAEDDGSVRVWNVSAGFTVGVWRGPAGVLSVGFDSGGRLACGGADGVVRVLSVGLGGVVEEFDCGPAGVLSVGFDGGGRLACGGADGVVRLVGGDPSRQLFEVSRHGLVGLSFLPKARALVACDAFREMSEIRWGGGSRNDQVSSSVVVNRRLLRDGSWPAVVAGSCSGVFLASVGSDGYVRIWERGDGGLVRVFGRAVRYPGVVAWSAGDTHLAVGSIDGEVVVYEVESGLAVLKLRVGDGSVSVVGLSGDGAYLVASLEGSSELAVHEVSDGGEVASWSIGDDVVSAAAFVGDDNQIVVLGSSGVLQVLPWRKS